MDQIASNQDGLVTMDQLVGAGGSTSSAYRATRTGRLVPVHAQVFRLAGAPVTWRQCVRAALLSVGMPAGSSHRTGLAVWGVAPPPDEPIEIAVPVQRRPSLPGVTVHRTRVWPEQVATVAGIPTMPLERIIVDLSGRTSSRVLGKWIDEGRRRGLLDVAAVERCLLGIGTGRSRRLGRVRDAAALRRESGPGVNHWEAELAQRLVAAGIEAPEHNVTVRAGGVAYELDLALRRYRIAIEFDGWEEHQKRDRFDSDREKDRRLAAAGWIVLRVTSRSDLDEVCAQVIELIRQRATAA